MRTLFIIGLCVFLANCAQDPQVVRSTEYRVVQPPANYYRCPNSQELLRGINVEKLTNNQVASLLSSLDSYNVECRNSLGAIRTYLIKAKAQFETNGQAR